MASEVILYGPDSEVYNNYAVLAPAPGVVKNTPAILHVRPFGTQLVLQDGRKFRFAASGASTLVTGNCLTAGVATASQQNLTAAAGAVGDLKATMTTGASTAQNVFAQGYLTVSVAPGFADCYKIANHLLMTTASGDVVNFWPGNQLRTATTTSSKYDLIDNVYSRVIQAPATTVASAPVGVAITVPVTLRGCWIQTRGTCGVLTSGTAIAGDVIGTGLGAAGAAGPIAALATQPIYGWCIFAAATTAASSFFLTIDG